jgi:cation diffusion facilitator CzcD-associated flavoprotein CzcO
MSGGSTPTVIILGAGVSGLCMGIQLLKAGISSFTILEKSDQVGGTWLDNQYPGAACDVPSHYYCFSFEPNPDWTHKYSRQPEIQRYLAHCAEKYRILPHVHFGTEVASASFDEASATWRVRTKRGETFEADVLVSGVGQLNRPFVPDLPGLSEFEGVSFHSARWNKAHDLNGKNVAVIGNGASAIQFIPHVAKQARKLTIFQRSPNWIVPRGDYAYGENAKKWFRRFPLALKPYRWWFYLRHEINYLAFGAQGRMARFMETAARAHMETHVPDPALRARLTPDYRVGCKRILIDDDFMPALARPNVEVVTEPIERIERDGVRTKDGVVHPADTLVLATGFETQSFLAPIQIEGLGGRKLDQVWGKGAEAYLGLTVSGFPNFFMMYGPNTNLGHNSIIFMIECQVRYAMQCIQALRKRGLRWLDVRPDVQQRYNAELQKELGETAWSAGCKSWYKNAEGKVTNNWSTWTVRYWWRTRRAKLADFEQVARA